MTGAVLFDGPKVELGGATFTAAPLSFEALEACREDLRLIADSAAVTMAELQGAIARVIHASIARNHPEVLLGAVAQALDWRSAPPILSQVMAISFPQVGAGEPMAASPSGASTGP